MQIIHIYIISPFKYKRTFINNIWEYGSSYFSPNCFVLNGNTINQVFYGVTWVPGSFQSAVEWSNFLRVFTGGRGLSYHIGIEAIQRVSSSVKAKEKPPFPSSVYSIISAWKRKILNVESHFWVVLNAQLLFWWICKNLQTY